MLVGSDFDGCYNASQEIRDMADIIITGRSWEEYEDTMDEAKIDIPVYFYPQRKGIGTLSDFGTWKANMINKLGITEFYEDDPLQISLLKIMCHETKIHKVEGGEF